MWPNPQSFTEEILNWKLHFLCSDSFNAWASEIDEADNNKISWNKTQIGKATHLVT